MLQNQGPDLSKEADSKLVMGLLLILIATTCTTTTSSTTCTIVFGDNGCTNSFDLLVFFLDLLGICLWVGVKPRLAIFQCIHDLLLLIGVHLLTEALVLTGAFRGRTHRVDVAVECILGIHALLDLLVLVR